jgi:hypothetical protein
MKWFAEKWTNEYTDEDGKKVKTIKYLYPYYAVEEKKPPYAKGITQVEIPDPPGEYFTPGIDDKNNFIWVPDKARFIAEQIRPERDALLNEVDLKHCNAERWELMTAEEKQAWREYKQALRDLPETVDVKGWPVKPGE